jgi:hypothetical protein
MREHVVPLARRALVTQRGAHRFGADHDPLRRTRRRLGDDAAVEVD